jgi:hypothetical protein
MPSPITTIVPRLECDDLPGVASIAQISEVHELDFVITENHRITIKLKFATACRKTRLV